MKRVNKLGTVCGVRKTAGNQSDPTVVTTFFMVCLTLNSEPRVLTVVMSSLFLTNKIPTKI
jgi:hypothetical protein